MRRDGQSGTVMAIRADHMTVLHEDWQMEFRHHLDGRFWNNHGSPYDLLPAIEEAGPAPFLDPTRESLEAIKEAWEDFTYVVTSEHVNPSNGGVCICGKMGLSIRCGYPDRYTAANDAIMVAAAIDRLLEGRAP